MLAVPGYDEKVEFGVLISFAYKVEDSGKPIAVQLSHCISGNVEREIYFTKLRSRLPKKVFKIAEKHAVAIEYVPHCHFGNLKCLFMAVRNSFCISNLLFEIAANMVWLW